jgi:outer membrane protein
LPSGGLAAGTGSKQEEIPMKKALMFVVAAVMAVPTFAQTTAPSRVAVFNVQKVLGDSVVGKAAYERLKKMQEERAGRVQKMQEEVTSLEQQLSQKKLSLSEDKYADLSKSYNDKKIALQRYAQDAEREMGDARDAALADMERQLVPVINAIGKEMGFAVIFNRMESGIVYASDAIDITGVIIKKFDEASKK